MNISHTGSEWLIIEIDSANEKEHSIQMYSLATGGLSSIYVGMMSKPIKLINALKYIMPFLFSYNVLGKTITTF